MLRTNCLEATVGSAVDGALRVARGTGTHGWMLGTGPEGTVPEW
jgi:hypothetical protein